MPNWANTSYIVTGDKSETEDLYQKMKALEDRTESLVKNDFGTTWLGNLVVEFGGDWNDIRCRGSWDSLEYDNISNSLSFTTETAWCEMAEWRHFVECKYKTLKMWYMTEEPGMCYYATNDRDGEFFPCQFCIEADDEFYERETEADIRRDAESIISRPLQEGENIETALNDWADENDVEYCNYHEYMIVDD